MHRSLLVLSLSLLLCASAFPQDSGTIQCDPGMDRVPTWVAPGRAYVITYLNCGQMVSVVGLERGYVRIRIGENFSYVDAKYVRLAYSQEKQATQTPQPAPPAATTQKAAQPINVDLEKPRRHEGGLSFEVSNIYYDEPDFMRNKGFMYGISGDYTYRPNNFMLRADGRFSLGDVDYWSDGSGTAEGLRDYNFETRFSFGYDLIASEKASFTPFIGFGYRYLFDGEEGAISTSGARDYDRKSNYLYSPIGMETMLRLKRGWSLGASGEYDLFLHGWQYSEIGDFLVTIYPLVGLPDFVAKNDQEGGWGARGSIRLTKNAGRVAFTTEPYLRRWSVKDSDAFQIQVLNLVGGLREPANTTTEWGLKLGIRF